MNRAGFLSLVAALLAACAAPLAGATTGFAYANGNHFEIDGQTQYYVGASYFNAMNLAADPGNRSILDNHFAGLQAMGITNVRIWASSEGAGGPELLTPTLQPTPGSYSETMFQGLDYALKSAKEHDLKIVMVLTNGWEWSGGMDQYVNWSPTTDKELENYSWGQGPRHDQFYTDVNCRSMYQSFIETIVNRENTAYAEGSRPLYKDDPTIFAWELANEPRAHAAGQTVLNEWIHTMAGYIKSLDSNHMVTTGSEGFIDNPASSAWWETPAYSGTDFVANHQSEHVDYATTHIWPFNWSWYPDPDSSDMTETFALAMQFLADHIASAQSDLGKPLVLEEFGLLRDNDHDGDGSEPPGSAVTERDALFQSYYEMLYNSAVAGGPAAGSNFWTYITDPPQEPQGMYSIYDPEDTTTVSLITQAAAAMNSLIPIRGDADGDGLINGYDMAVWQVHYDPLGLNPGNSWETGDWTGDGLIDGLDLAYWQQNYDSLGTGVKTVPEPSTILLVLTGLAALARRRHARDFFLDSP